MIIVIHHIRAETDHHTDLKGMFVPLIISKLCSVFFFPCQKYIVFSLLLFFHFLPIPININFLMLNIETSLKSLSFFFNQKQAFCVMVIGELDERTSP